MQLLQLGQNLSDPLIQQMLFNNRLRLRLWSKEILLITYYYMEKFKELKKMGDGSFGTVTKAMNI
jgi:hypothetical protein